MFMFYQTRKLPLGDCKGNAFMTTVASRGRGKGIVVRIGVSTEIGKISSAIAATPHTKTNIEKKLGQLGLWLVIISLVLVLIIVGIGLGYKRPAKETILVGVSLAVSVIPEGLVAVVTSLIFLGFNIF
jgi:P-type Ca2+ transporter type 2C